jgi:hypothetical protein
VIVTCGCGAQTEVRVTYADTTTDYDRGRLTTNVMEHAMSREVIVHREHTARCRRKDAQ